MKLIIVEPSEVRPDEAEQWAKVVFFQLSSLLKVMMLSISAGLFATSHTSLAEIDDIKKDFTRPIFAKIYTHRNVDH